MLYKILCSENGDVFIVMYEQGHWYKPICILTADDVEDLYALTHIAREKSGGKYATNKES